MRVVLSVLLAALTGCSRQSPPAAGGDPSTTPQCKGIVLVTVEQFRADVSTLYGRAKELPALSELATRGVVFDDATSISPMARPALATLLTGISPDKSGVRDEHYDRLSDEVPTVAATMARAGFKTAAFVGSPLASYASGFDRGFDIFDGPDDLTIGPSRTFPVLRPAMTSVENFKRWLSALSPSDRPFAWIHLADLRGTMFEGDVDAGRAAYEKALLAVDGAIGAIVATLSDRPGAEIVVVGTHGALLGEDGNRGDAYWLRSETLDVPLVWSGGRATQGRRDDRPVWTPDVPATILAAVGQNPPDNDGMNLFGGPIPRARRRLAWTWATDDEFGWAPISAERTGGTWALAPNLGRAAKARGHRLTTDQRERLAAAGFKLGSARGGSAPPEDADRLIGTVLEARHRLAKDRLRPAWRAFLRMTNERPEVLAGWTHRLYLASLTGNKELMDPAVSAALLRFPESPEVLHWAGHCEFAAGRPARAEALVAAAMSLGGQAEADMLYDMACARSLENDGAGAIQWLEKSFAAGYRNWDWIQRDPDLTAARAQPRFAALLRASGR